MCLYIKHSRYNGVCTTTRDYYVYKRLEKVSSIRYRSPFMGYYFTVDNTYVHVAKGFDANRSGYETIVSRGFHAYRTKRTAIRCLYAYGTVVRCIIPAGSRVYFGQNDEVCSDKLIVPLDSDLLYKSLIGEPYEQR